MIFQLFHPFGGGDMFPAIVSWTFGPSTAEDEIQLCISLQYLDENPPVPVGGESDWVA